MRVLFYMLFPYCRQEDVACPRLAASTAQALEGGGDQSAAPCLPDRVLCGVRGPGTTRDLEQRCVLLVGGNWGLPGQSGADLPRPSSLTLLGLSFFARAFRMAVILFSFSSTGRLS